MLYKTSLARGWGENHIHFQKQADKMTYCLPESKMSKTNVSNNSFGEKKPTVNKLQTWSHPFQHAA